jgi:sRNA-binding carbon storage regulator CsrA
MEYGRLVLSRNDGEGILIGNDMYRFFCARRIYFTCWQNKVHSMPYGVEIEQKTSAGETIYIALASMREKRNQIKVAIIAPRHIDIFREELVEDECDDISQADDRCRVEGCACLEY